MLTLFWDIDGTLVTTADAGRAAWCQAAAEVSGEAVDWGTLRTAGLTDVQIADLIARHVDPADHAALALAVLARYEALLPMYLPQTAGRVLPNVRAILDCLAHAEEAWAPAALEGGAAGAGLSGE